MLHTGRLLKISWARFFTSLHPVSLVLPGEKSIRSGCIDRLCSVGDGFAKQDAAEPGTPLALLRLRSASTCILLCCLFKSHRLMRSLPSDPLFLLIISGYLWLPRKKKFWAPLKITSCLQVGFLVFLWRVCPFCTFSLLSLSQSRRAQIFEK